MFLSARTLSWNTAKRPQFATRTAQTVYSLWSWRKRCHLERNTTENNGCNDLWVNLTCNSPVANLPVHNYLLLKNETKVSLNKKGTWIEKMSRGETFVYQCRANQKTDNVKRSNNVIVAVSGKVAILLKDATSILWQWMANRCTTFFFHHSLDVKME